MRCRLLKLMDCGIVLVAVPSEEEGRAIAAALLTATASLIPMHSIYLWQGEVKSHPEWQLKITTRLMLLPALTAKIQALHSSEVPEIASLSLTAASPAYSNGICENAIAENLLCWQKETEIIVDLLPIMPKFSLQEDQEQFWYVRFLAAILLTGQVCVRLVRGKIYPRKVIEQMANAGPGSLLPVLLVTGLSGMIFTLQMGRYLNQYNALNTLGGAFGEAFCRELAPILTASVVAGQVGSAFAAEIGAMRVTEQIDALQMLRTDPINYLVIPRTIACAVMVPVLTVFALAIGLMAGAWVAEQFYKLPATAFLDSVRAFLMPLDVLKTLFKAFIFGIIDALIGCSWGLTTRGGAKEVGQSATAAVVTSWILIFFADFCLSFALYGQPVL